MNKLNKLGSERTATSTPGTGGQEVQGKRSACRSVERPATTANQRSGAQIS